MFNGVAAVVGPVMAGLLYQISESYVLSFVFNGFSIALSGAMCFFIPFLNNYKGNGNKTEKRSEI